jgi:hypothetical protein
MRVKPTIITFTNFLGTAGSKEAVDVWITSYNDKVKFASSKFVVYEDIYFQTKDYNNSVRPIEGFETKEEVNKFIEANKDKYEGGLDYLPQSDYSTLLSLGNINKGMFGHIRTWQDDTTFYVAELQSDYFQKYNARRELLENSKDYTDVQKEKENKESDLKVKKNSTFIKLKDLGYRFVTGRKGALTQTEVYIPKNKYGLPLGDRTGVKLVEKDGYYTIDNNGTNPNGNYYADKQLAETDLERIANEEGRDLDKVTYLNKSELPLELQEDYVFLTESYYKELSNIEKEYNKKLESVVQNAPIQEKQFIASQKIWEQRMVRESIKEAALSGATTLRFPTPYTISVIEGYVSDKGNAPYEVINADNSSQLTEGDIINYVGMDYRVIEANSSEITVASLEDVYYHNAKRYLEHKISFNTKETMNNELGFETQNAFYTLEEWDEIKEDTYFLFRDVDLEDIATQRDGNLYEIDESKVEKIVREDYSNEFTDAEVLLMVEGYQNIFTIGGNVYYTKYRVTTETFGQPNTYGTNSKDDFSIESLNDDQQTVARKYVEIANVLKKERGEENLEVVTDENGFDWYETKIEESESQKPVIAFQKTAEQKVFELIQSGEIEATCKL